MLNYNAFSSGSLEVRKDTVDLQALLTEIVYQWQLTQIETSVEVQFEQRTEPWNVMGDALRIQQIMVNLLNNALQAAVPERALRILVKVSDAGGAVRIEVEDNGCGINTEERPHVFERFYRGARKQRHTRGLGLGLTYSQLLARAQGGDLLLSEATMPMDGAEACGSCFVLILPKINMDV